MDMSKLLDDVVTDMLENSETFSAAQSFDHQVEVFNFLAHW
jgi:hypothetical protein